MNRREFIGAATAAILAPLLPAGEIATPPLHAWYVADNEESHWFAATSEQEARELYHEYFGQYATPDWDRPIIQIEVIHDSNMIRVVDAGPNGETITKTAGEWAREAGGPELIATTEGF